MFTAYLLWSLLTGESVYKPKEWIEYSILRSGGGVVVLTVTVTVDLLARVMLTTRRRRGWAGGVVTALYDHAVHHCSLTLISVCSAWTEGWHCPAGYRQPPGPGPPRHTATSSSPGSGGKYDKIDQPDQVSPPASRQPIGNLHLHLHLHLLLLRG